MKRKLASLIGGLAACILSLCWPKTALAQDHLARLDALFKDAVAAYQGFDADESERRTQALLAECRRLKLPQEELWALYALDHDSEALKLEGDLQLRMKIENVVGDLPVSLAKQEVRKLKLESGIWVLARAQGDRFTFEVPSVRHDLLAYQVSRALGFHLVPVTTLRSYKDRLMSVQLLIENHRPGDRDFTSQDYTDEKLHVFDFIMQQMDRNGKNWFYGMGGRAVAIDNDVVHGTVAHELALKVRQVRAQHPPKSLTPEVRKGVQQLQKKLTGFSDQFPFMRETERHFMLQRIEILLALPVNCAPDLAS